MRENRQCHSLRSVSCVQWQPPLDHPLATHSLDGARWRPILERKTHSDAAATTISPKRDIQNGGIEILTFGVAMSHFVVLVLLCLPTVPFDVLRWRQHGLSTSIGKQDCLELLDRDGLVVVGMLRTHRIDSCAKTSNPCQKVMLSQFACDHSWDFRLAHGTS